VWHGVWCVWRVCGGVWWRVEACGGVRRRVVACGGMWRRVAASGGVWQRGGVRWREQRGVVCRRKSGGCRVAWCGYGRKGKLTLLQHPIYFS
jgi:hypothetical protein